MAESKERKAKCVGWLVASFNVYVYMYHVLRSIWFNDFRWLWRSVFAAQHRLDNVSSHDYVVLTFYSHLKTIETRVKWWAPYRSTPESSSHCMINAYMMHIEKPRALCWYRFLHTVEVGDKKMRAWNWMGCIGRHFDWAPVLRFQFWMIRIRWLGMIYI